MGAKQTHPQLDQGAVRTAPHIRHIRYAASEARGSGVVNGGIHGMRAAMAGGGSGSALSFMACNSSVQFCIRPDTPGAALKASRFTVFSVMQSFSRHFWTDGLVGHQQPAGVFARGA
jgi:hypothetical protein